MRLDANPVPNQRLEPDRANLAAEAPHLPSDRKNELFGVGRFEHFFDQKRSGDKDR